MFPIIKDNFKYEAITIFKVCYESHFLTPTRRHNFLFLSDRSINLPRRTVFIYIYKWITTTAGTAFAGALWWSTLVIAHSFAKAQIFYIDIHIYIYIYRYNYESEIYALRLKRTEWMYRSDSHSSTCCGAESCFIFSLWYSCLVSFWT